MKVHRRTFLRGATGLAAAVSGVKGGSAASGATDFSTLRQDFHLRPGQAYLNSARHYPLNIHAERALRSYLEHMKRDPADEFERRRLHGIKSRFAKLINAKPSEIAFTPGTMAGEMILMDGLGLENSGYNLVTNDLPYSASLYNYSQRKKHGLDLRVVKLSNWTTDLRQV